MTASILVLYTTTTPSTQFSAVNILCTTKILRMTWTVVGNDIDCWWKWHRLWLEMTSTVVGNDIHCSWKWHRLLLEMTSIVVGNDMDCCWKWHRLLVKMTSTVAGSDINCCWKWHRLLLEVTSNFYATSFPGSSLSREKDLGWVWSGGIQILGGDK